MDFSWIFHAKIKSRDSSSRRPISQKQFLLIFAWHFIFLFQLLDNDDEKNLKSEMTKNKKKKQEILQLFVLVLFIYFCLFVVVFIF